MSDVVDEPSSSSSRSGSGGVGYAATVMFVLLLLLGAVAQGRDVAVGDEVEENSENSENSAPVAWELETETETSGDGEGAAVTRPPLLAAAKVSAAADIPSTSWRPPNGTTWYPLGPTTRTSRKLARVRAKARG